MIAPFDWWDILFCLFSAVTADCPDLYMSSPSGSCYKKDTACSGEGIQLADIVSKRERQFIVDNFAELAGMSQTGLIERPTARWGKTGW